MQDFVSNLSCFLLLACSLARLLACCDLPIDLRFAFCSFLLMLACVVVLGKEREEQERERGTRVGLKI